MTDEQHDTSPATWGDGPGGQELWHQRREHPMTVYETITLELAIRQRDEAERRLREIRRLCARHQGEQREPGHALIPAEQVIALLGPDPMQGRDQQEDDA